MDLTTIEGVRSLMSSSHSESDWNNNCDKAKKANDRQYPAFWFREIIMSGLLAETRKRWR